MPYASPSDAPYTATFIYPVDVSSAAAGTSAWPDGPKR
jgi:hypothetical protein